MRVVGVEPTRLAAQEPKSCASANSTIPAYSSILQLRPNRLNIVSVPAAKVNHCIDISALHSAYYRRTIVSFSMAERGFLPMRRSKLRRAGSIAAAYLLVAALAVLGYGSQEIAAALKGIDKDALPLEEIIRQSLKKMVK